MGSTGQTHVYRQRLESKGQLLLGIIALWGAAPPRQVSALDLSGDGTKPSSVYYTLRKDTRACVSPGCGGYFVAQANRAMTLCADGTTAPECYVAELALPKGADAEQGDLVHGSLALHEFPSGDFGVLTGDAVLMPTVSAALRAADVYALFYDTGIRCVTTPCPSRALVELNRMSAPRTDLAPRFLGDAATRAVLQDAFDAEYIKESPLGHGTIVLGRVQQRVDEKTGTTSSAFAIRDVLTTQTAQPVEPAQGSACVVHTAGGRITAWNFTSVEAAEERVAELGSGATSFEGTCTAMAQALSCPLYFDPVHGTVESSTGSECRDAGNGCEFRTVVIAASGDTSKATGSYSPGGCGLTPLRQ